MEALLECAALVALRLLCHGSKNGAVACCTGKHSLEQAAARKGHLRVAGIQKDLELKVRSRPGRTYPTFFVTLARTGNRTPAALAARS